MKMKTNQQKTHQDYTLDIPRLSPSRVTTHWGYTDTTRISWDSGSDDDVIEVSFPSTFLQPR